MISKIKKIILPGMIIQCLFICSSCETLPEKECSRHDTIRCQGIIDQCKTVSSYNNISNEEKINRIDIYLENVRKNDEITLKEKHLIKYSVINVW